MKGVGQAATVSLNLFLRFVLSLFLSLFLSVSLSLFVFGNSANAAQQAQTVTNTDLKAKPEPKANTVASLPNGSSLIVNERKGGWYAAETSLGKGWVRLLHVRLAGIGSATGKDGTAALITLGSLSRTDTTVATGIRGLTADDLKQAHENPRELAKLDGYAISDAEARQFANQGGVVSRPVGKE